MKLINQLIIGSAAALLLSSSALATITADCQGGKVSLKLADISRPPITLYFDNGDSTTVSTAGNSDICPSHSKSYTITSINHGWNTANQVNIALKPNDLHNSVSAIDSAHFYKCTNGQVACLMYENGELSTGYAFGG